ncbi:DegV family protein [Patescibacteria group bacterium]|nr:DegV family protein [Patescibacteria group bacterium]MBU2544243.1 DegV family protein [Patescibacteria group bacterium]
MGHMTVESELHIVTDSTCDLPDAEGYTKIPAIVTIEGKDYFDGLDITPPEILRVMEEEKVVPTTGAPGPEYIKTILRELQGKIVAIHVAEKLSGFLSSVKTAASQLNLGEKIAFFDSGVTSVALGHMVTEAVRLRDEGRPTDEIMRHLESLRERVKIWVTFDTLENARRSGRISNVRAVMGSILDIKPILGLANGEFFQIEMMRTRKKAIERLLSLVAESGPFEWLGVVHARALEEAQNLAERLKDLVPHAIGVTHLGPALSIHGGPGVLGACGFTQKIE